MKPEYRRSAAGRLRKLLTAKHCSLQLSRTMVVMTGISQFQQGRRLSSIILRSGTDFDRLEGGLDLEAVTRWRSAGGGDRLKLDGWWIVYGCYREFTSMHLGISNQISPGIWIVHYCCRCGLVSLGNNLRLY
jgi:hypothetical protein